MEHDPLFQLEHDPLFQYEQIYAQLRAYLLQERPEETDAITKCIKQFFRDKYSSRSFRVLCSGEQSCEYLVDVLVTTFDPKDLINNPKDLIKSERGALTLKPTSFDVHLAVESELGGTSASGAYGVMRNAAEDFMKLLLISARRRVMVMTSLPYRGEERHCEARIETLRQMYVRFPNLDSGVLVVHLRGNQPKSTQVQALVLEDSIRGFVISPDGQAANELPSETVHV